MFLYSHALSLKKSLVAIKMIGQQLYQVEERIPRDLELVMYWVWITPAGAGVFSSFSLTGVTLVRPLKEMQHNWFSLKENA